MACAAELELSSQLADIDKLIRANEARLRTIEGVRLYTEKNKIARLSQANIEEISLLY